MIAVDHSSATPAFDQIREQLTGLIRLGALPPGRRLPSIRQLAADLAVAPGTVARAFGELERAGLIVTSRSGAVVRSDAAAPPPIAAAAARFGAIAHAAGLSLEDAVAALRMGWAD